MWLCFSFPICSSPQVPSGSQESMAVSYLGKASIRDNFANEAISCDTTDFDLFMLNGSLLTCQTYPVGGHQGMLQTDSDHLLPFLKLTKDRSFLGSY